MHMHEPTASKTSALIPRDRYHLRTDRNHMYKQNKNKLLVNTYT